jgi:S1-C subfamily serine protease
MSSVTTLVLLVATLGAQPRGEVLNFSSRSCGPCQQMSPIVSRLARDGLPIRKVDVEQERSLTEQFRVDRIPTFVLVIDGREANRHVGPMSEADLRRMLARIPAPEPEAAPPVVAASAAEHAAPAHRNVNTSTTLGEPRDNLQSTVAEAPAAATGETERRSLLDIFKPRDQQPKPDVVRGNDPEPPPAPVVAAANDPMAASVRIHVTINGKISVGSGTIVDSRPGRTLIVTCGHIFRHLDQTSKVEVDLFEAGQARTHVGTVVRFNLESDVGLVSVPTAAAVASTTIAPPGYDVKNADRVACIGCSGGNDPTREQLTVTAVNKYSGPDNIECTGIPVQGRSGGGLFDTEGRLIGVCVAADQEAQRGFYSHVFTVHDLLDECNLAALYQPRTVPEPDALAFARVEAPPAAPGDVMADLGAPAAAPVAAAAPATPAASTATPETVAVATNEDILAGDAEVVVVIRQRNQPDAPSRIVIINQASPKFLSYLNAEMQPAATTAQRVPAAGRLVETTTPAAEELLPPRRHESRRAASDGRPSALAPPPRRQTTKAALQPTALSQPVPRAYVRSTESRRGSCTR